MKFQFAKDFTTRVAVGGVVGLQNKTFKAGEVYEGYLPIGGGAIATIKWGNENPLMQGFSPITSVPYEYLVLDANGSPKDVTNDILSQENKSQNGSNTNGATTNWKPLLLILGVLGISFFILRKKK
jgi:hypothetical protein